MDPDALLDDLLTRAREALNRVEGQASFSEADEELLVLAEGVLALDDWLSSGGFGPRRWPAYAPPTGIPVPTAQPTQNGTSA